MSSRLTLPSDRAGTRTGGSLRRVRRTRSPFRRACPSSAPGIGVRRLAELGPQRGSQLLVERPCPVPLADISALRARPCARRRRGGRTGPRRCARSSRSARRPRGSGRRPRSPPASAPRAQRPRPTWTRKNTSQIEAPESFTIRATAASSSTFCAHHHRVHLHRDPVPAQPLDGRQRVREVALDAANPVMGRGSRPVEADRHHLDPGAAQLGDTLVGQQGRHARCERDRQLELGSLHEEPVEVAALEHVAARGDEHGSGGVEAPERLEEGPPLGGGELARKWRSDRRGAAVAARKPARPRRLPEDEDRAAVEVQPRSACVRRHSPQHGRPHPPANPGNPGFAELPGWSAHFRLFRPRGAPGIASGGSTGSGLPSRALG